MIPDRIQRSRKKESRQPPNTKYCGRAGRDGGYGNPFVVRRSKVDRLWHVIFSPRRENEDLKSFETKLEAQQYAVEMFKLWFNPEISTAKSSPALHAFRERFGFFGFAKAILATTNAGLLSYDHLSCFCKLSDPCHVDVIIDVLRGAQ